ncbi:hypothetical protein [Mucisphaera sp.]|uniref:hypothetical protein n=1 Tax=Mucisphaera sp. TaxID=2913024 RepID=UPI003D0F9DEF
MHRCWLSILFCLCLSATTHAQTLAELRRQLSEDLRQIQFVKSLNTLILVSDELELSGVNLDIDGDPDTDLRGFSIPFSRSFFTNDEASIGVHLEGAIGYATARQQIADIYDGVAPAFATSVDTEWSSFGTIFGAGPTFRLAPGLRLTFIGNVSLGRFENRTDYGGPGRAFSAALADGIAFNWDAVSAGYGGATRIDYQIELAPDYLLETRARYDLRYNHTFSGDDPAQEASERAQILTLRADLSGPTGLELFGQPLRWKATAGYRNFVEGTLFGVSNYVQLGGGFEIPGVLPFDTGLNLQAAYITGDSVEGYSLGAGLSF